jgi:uncharacterized coiled-coil protein SlyX
MPSFQHHDNIMEKDIGASITRLEMLYSEQEYTIQALNQITTRQDQEISRLKSDLQLLKRQLLDLKTNLPQQISGDEKPPHY